jgi:serine/threonine protein kinase
MPAPTTVSDLLELVRKSGLLDAQRLDGYLKQQRDAGTLPGEPGPLASALVRDGLLTHFQAQQLMLGKWRPFTISGKYRLLEHLGTGGMGMVYLCEHTLMHRRVAIKVLPAAKAQDPSSLERFHREARAVAALDHPNIVRAHDIDHDGKLHFLVMEYVDGSSLHDLVKRHGPMDVTRAAHYIRQAAFGLQHAHEAGLVHRDIKPGNLLVDRHGVVKLLDMGLARFFHDESDNITKKHNENILGTADYLAPEQALDSNVDIRADIYSLGVTFYYLLTGKGPFADGTTAQKMIWHQVRQPKPVQSLRAEVPDALAAVVEKMMAKGPEERYQSPAEVVEALAPWTQEPVAPPPEEEMPRLCPAARGGQDGGPTGTPSPSPRPRGAGVPFSPGPQSRRSPPPGALPGPARPTTPKPDASARAVDPSDPAAATRIAGHTRPAPATGFIKAAPDHDKPQAANPGVPDTDEALARAETLPGPPDKASPAAREPAAKMPRPTAPAPAWRNRRLLWVVAVCSVLGLACVGAGLWWVLSRSAGKATPLASGSPAPADKTPRANEAPPSPRAEAPAPAGNDTGGEVRRFLGHASGLARVAFSPDGRRALTGSLDHTVPLWDVATGRELRHFEGHTDSAYSVAFSPDGRRALTGGFDKTARVWDVETGKELCRFEGHANPVWAVAYFPDGRRAISASNDHTADIWDVSIGQELKHLAGHGGAIHAVAVTPDQRLALTASWDKTAGVWDTASGQLVRRFEGHTAEVLSVACSPDGRYGLSGGMDGTMRRWEVETAKEVRVFQGHTSTVSSVAFSPGGRYAVSGSFDKTVRVWEVNTGRCLRAFEGHTQAIIGVAYSPDGRHVLSGSLDKTARLWELPASVGPEPTVAAPVAPAPPASLLKVLTPTPRQVVQRDANNRARLAIAGYVESAVTAVEARLAGMPQPGIGGSDWKRVAGQADIKDGAFQGALAAVPGGRYVVEVRARNGDRVVGQARVEKVGVGEVFITAGQSNAANYGDARQSPKDDRVSAWDGSGWRLAGDPQPLATGEGGTPWPALGDLLAERLQVPIGFVSLGVGATSAEQWQPEGKLYPHLKNALAHFGKDGVRAVLWHQGESDTLVGTSADQYAERLGRIIKQSRLDAGYDVKWFVAGVAWVGPEHRAKEAAVRAGQKKVCDGKQTFAGPVTDDLKGDTRTKSDGVHFSDKGLKEHGRAWAEVLLKTLFGGK